MNDFEVGIFDVVGKFNYFSEVPLALEYQPKSHLSFIFCTRREKAVRYCGGLRTKNASTQSERLEAYEKVNCFLLYLLFSSTQNGSRNIERCNDQTNFVSPIPRAL